MRIEKPLANPVATFFRSRWLGQVPLDRLFWRDMVLVGTAISIASSVAALVLLYFGQRLLRQAWRGFAPVLATRAAVMALLVLAVGFEFVAPALDALWLSRSAAALIASAGVNPDMPVAVAGDAEPSLVFMLGTKTKLVSAEAAADYLATTPNARALVETRSETEFTAALAASKGRRP